MATTAMVGSYNYHLVALSVLIAVFASYAALDLAGRTTAASGRVRFAWLAGGATAMGVGIWSMHYIGMLAFSLYVPVFYDWPTVLLSLIAAVFASAVALFVISRQKMGWPQALAGSAIMGSGIATMHYTGMAAMRLPAMCSYDPLLVSLSVLLAIVISLVALWLTFRLREDAKASLWWKSASAVVMGAAIPVMHYTGMAAARFTPSSTIPNTATSVSMSTLGIASVTAVTLLVLSVAVLTSVVDRRFSAQKVQLNEAVKAHAELLDAANDAIFVRSLHASITYWNKGAERLYGWTKDEAIGKSPRELFQVEFPSTFEEVVKASREGGWEGEIVQTKRDGTKITVASRWTTLLDAQNNAVGWLTINTDITRRRVAEESARQLSAHLLKIQDDERRRIARELHDSAGQILAALAMNLDRIHSSAKLNPEQTRLLSDSDALVKDATKELRTISHLLHPPLLDEVGLPSALRWYVDGFAKRSGINTMLELAADFGRLPPDFEIAVFRIVQESLTNIHRHSGSPSAEVRLMRANGEVRLEVLDRGKGMPIEKQQSLAANGPLGVGLRGMRERVTQLGGILDVRTSDSGTIVTAILPAEQKAIVTDAAATQQIA